MLLITCISGWFLNTSIIAGYCLSNDGTYDLTADGFYIRYGGGREVREEFLHITIVLWLLVAISFINIFLFKNRNLQNALCILTYPLILAFCALLTNEWFSQISDEMPINSITYGSVAKICLAVGLLVLNYLAMRGLRKDEELIRSADRLR